MKYAPHSNIKYRRSGYFRAFNFRHLTVPQCSAYTLLGLQNIDKVMKSLGTTEKKLHNKWFKISLLKMYLIWALSHWRTTPTLYDRKKVSQTTKRLSSLGNSLRPSDLFCMWDLVWARGNLVGSCLLLKKVLSFIQLVVRLWWMCKEALWDKDNHPSTWLVSNHQKITLLSLSMLVHKHTLLCIV